MFIPEETRVLIVDDETLIREVVKSLLIKIGYQIAGEAVNGHQAIEMTQELHPDVVLMDIQMPSMSGIEASRLIFEQCPTPIVVLTAYDNMKVVEAATEAGVGAYLVKPPKLQEIQRAITVARARFNDMIQLRRLNDQLQDALAKIETLQGLIPICAHCKKVRDDAGDWKQIELYIRDRSKADFSHGICPECAGKLYAKLHIPVEK